MGSKVLLRFQTFKLLFRMTESLSPASIPIAITKRHSYAVLVQAIRESEGWMEVDLSQVGGKTLKQKRTRLLNTCRIGDVEVVTAVRDGKLFVMKNRIVEEN